MSGQHFHAYPAPHTLVTYLAALTGVPLKHKLSTHHIGPTTKRTMIAKNDPHIPNDLLTTLPQQEQSHRRIKERPEEPTLSPAPGN